MGVKDADAVMALFELNDQLTARRVAIYEGSFSVIVEPEGYPPQKINLSPTELETVREALHGAIDREYADVKRGLQQQGVQDGGTITISKLGTDKGG
jgi:hypothetical protein